MPELTSLYLCLWPYILMAVAVIYVSVLFTPLHAAALVLRFMYC